MPDVISRLEKGLWNPKGMDRTPPGEQIEISGLKQVSPVLLDQIEGATLIVPAGRDAAHIRRGLRGSVIESDLQSLCVREDGLDLLTGCAPTDAAISALHRAGLAADILARISDWGADEIAVHFIDGRRYHRIVRGATRDSMSGNLTPDKMDFRGDLSMAGTFQESDDSPKEKRNA